MSDWTAHALNDICEFSLGVDAFNSLFLLLIEFGLQIRQFVPLSFLMTIPGHSIQEQPQPYGSRSVHQAEY